MVNITIADTAPSFLIGTPLGTIGTSLGVTFVTDELTKLEVKIKARERLDI